MQAKNLALPDPFNAVSIEDCVDADDRHSEFQRLRNQQPVKWIAVMEGQQRRPNCMERVNLNGRELLFAQDTEKVGNQDVWRHLSCVHLESDFPRDDRRNQDFIRRIGN